MSHAPMFSVQHSIKFPDHYSHQLECGHVAVSYVRLPEVAVVPCFECEDITLATHWVLA